MSSRNSTSLESCDCKPSGNVLILNDCDKCCETGIKKDFCLKNQTCIYRKSGFSKGVEKCPCSGAKAELAHRSISKREKCLKCCKETKFTFNRFISMCQMDPDCIINMYKTRNTNGRLLPEIENENMPGNLMVDQNMEACDSDEEQSNLRPILVAKAPIVLTKYNPQQTRLSAWSNRGPSIIWSYYDPEGSTVGDVKPLSAIEEEPDGKINGGSYYREIQQPKWDKTKQIDSDTSPSTQPSTNESSKDQSKILQPSSKTSDESSQIGGTGSDVDEAPETVHLATLYDGSEEEENHNISEANEDRRHTHFQVNEHFPEASQTPSAKRKSISFAQPIDSPKISQPSSGMESQFLVLNQVIAQQNKDTKKNSIESMQSALGKVRCSNLLNILPWRWKCFKRKKIEKSKSHSITESVVSDSATKYLGNASVSV